MLSPTLTLTVFRTSKCGRTETLRATVAACFQKALFALQRTRVNLMEVSLYFIHDGWMQERLGGGAGLQPFSESMPIQS